MDDDQRLARAAEAFVLEALERSRSHEPHAAETPDAGAPDARVAGASPVQRVPPTSNPAAGAPASIPAVAWPRGGSDRRVSASTTSSAATPPDADPPRILSREEWGSAVSREAARWHRHGGSVALLAIRLARRALRHDTTGEDPGMPAPADDPHAAERYAVPLGQTIRQRARASDRVAHLGPDAFAVMLLETGESGAMAYADRIRSTCEPWIRAVPGDLVLRIGWAVPHLGDSIEQAAADVVREVTAGPATDPAPVG